MTKHGKVQERSEYLCKAIYMYNTAVSLVMATTYNTTIWGNKLVCDYHSITPLL